MPSKSDIEADKRSRLRREGCADCDENDPDKLDIYHPDVPPQTRHIPEHILCNECAADRDL